MVLKKLEKHHNIQNVNLNMSKKNLHPKWYSTKVYCDGKLILEVGSTKKELYVDIWSGNHPIYTGSQKIMDTEGRIDLFEKRYKINK
jgi:large subunit ribosomal protein L31